MTKTPPDSPAVSAQERQAARTLAEHLPQGYTADFVPEDQQATEGGDAEGRPNVGGRNVSGGSGTNGSGVDSQPTPSIVLPTGTPTSTPASVHDGEQPEEISSLHLQGGDVHRSLFRMAEAPQRAQILQNQPLLTPSPLSLSTTATSAEDHAVQAQGQSSSQEPPSQAQPSPAPTPTQHPKKPHHRRAATFHDRYTPSEVSSMAGDDDGDGNGHGSGNDGDHNGGMHVRDLLAPQGFRRDFVLQQIRQRQLQAREATMQRRRSHIRERRANAAFSAVKVPIARNFVEFLELYGHFADEDLDDDDDDDEEEEGEEVDEEEEEEDEEAGRDIERGVGAGPVRRRPHERQPLLGRRQSGAVASAHAHHDGDGSGKAKAGMSQAFFTLLKAFVGTGIMFLPKAYNNGGMVFSTVTLLIVSLLSMAGFELLLQCRQRYGGGYGDIGLAIAGPRMRSLILGSISLSQLGFVCAGIVFAAENLASFASAVAHSYTRHSPSGGDGGVDDSVLSTNAIIAMEVAVLIPLGFVRDIARLGPAALLGDIFIAIGLVYMYTYDIAVIASRNWHLHPTVQFWFNPSGYALTIGATIFTFEGIGLILPIQSSMARPEKFRWLLGVVMAIITAAYISVGALGYAAFGTGTKTEVIDNYPRASALVQAVQCLYAIAVLSGMPVQLFPAVRIIEGRLFRTKSYTSENGAVVYYRSGKRDPRIKWAKNGLRTVMVVACGAVAVLGAGHLDQFVALIGSMACVPLLFIYPPYLHFRGMSDESSALVRALDIGLIAVGTVAMIYTTIVTIKGGL